MYNRIAKESIILLMAVTQLGHFPFNRTAPYQSLLINQKHPHMCLPTVWVFFFHGPFNDLYSKRVYIGTIVPTVVHSIYTVLYISIPKVLRLVN